MAEPFLRCEVKVMAGALAVEVHLALAAPWTTLFGASGSGKTTLLRAMAGFVRPRRGRIALAGGPVLFDSVAGVAIPAAQRPFRTAAQRAWALPGSVERNLRYGVRAPEQAAEQECVALFELESLLRKPMHALSGGELQRVSLARTVLSALDARGPMILLLDEPFTGLDAALRDRLAPALREFALRRQLPVLSVTHDVAEAHLLEAEVVRLGGGKVVAQGPAREVLAAERASLLKILKR